MHFEIPTERLAKNPTASRSLNQETLDFEEFRNTNLPDTQLTLGLTHHAYLLKIEGLFTRGSRPGRTLGESVGAILDTDSLYD